MAHQAANWSASKQCGMTSLKGLCNNQEVKGHQSKAEQKESEWGPEDGNISRNFQPVDLGVNKKLVYRWRNDWLFVLYP
jgi:hypothetical protein